MQSDDTEYDAGEALADRVRHAQQYARAARAAMEAGNLDAAERWAAETEAALSDARSLVGETMTVPAS